MPCVITVARLLQKLEARKNVSYWMVFLENAVEKNKKL